jgi:hypothetical protein
MRKSCSRSNCARTLTQHRRWRRSANPGVGHGVGGAHFCQRPRTRTCHTASAPAELTPNQTRPAPGGMGAGRCRRGGDDRETPAPPPTPARRGRACLCLTSLSVGAIGCVTPARPSAAHGRPRGQGVGPGYRPSERIGARLDGTRQSARCLSYIASRVARAGVAARGG